MVTFSLILFTYDRFEYAERSLRAALDHLNYPRIHVHIADDGSPDGQVKQLIEIAGGYSNVPIVTSSNAERGGYGRSYNLATQMVHQHADVVLCLEDDWELTRNFDPTKYLECLANDRRIGCIRLGYLGFTQPLYGEFVKAAGEIMLLLSPDSPEPHVFAGHPRLESVAWQKGVGPWPEGLPAGLTEFEVAHIKHARCGVAWPVDRVHPWGSLFAHIGARRAGE